MKIITEQILSVKGTQSCYNIFFSLPPFPKLSLSKQLPSKKELFIFEVFIAHMTILFGQVTFLAFWKDKSCSRNLESVMNALQKNFLVRQINLKRYKVTDYWWYFMRKWRCFKRDLSRQFFRALWNVIISFVKVNENLVTKWVLRMITWAIRGSNSLFIAAEAQNLNFLHLHLNL